MLEYQIHSQAALVTWQGVAKLDRSVQYRSRNVLIFFGNQATPYTGAIMGEKRWVGVDIRRFKLLILNIKERVLEYRQMPQKALPEIQKRNIVNITRNVADIKYQPRKKSCIEYQYSN